MLPAWLLIEKTLLDISPVMHLAMRDGQSVGFQLITPIVVRVVFRTHLPEPKKLIPVGCLADPSSFDSFSELPEAIRRLTVFPEPLLHILVHLQMPAIEPPAMIIDFERVPVGGVLMENELLEQIGGAVLAFE